ncbi:MAG TPA: hypothetical protein VFO18_11345 [Methylomirabilota bacterium]|nr:hypothetical protein [Methylomirabilota bacterium]
MVGAANQSPAPERHPGRRLPDPPVIPLPSLSALVEAAASAPSGDNCQPWRFRWDGHALQILIDPERAESFYDFRQVASWVALGALLENLDLAAASRGLQPVVELWPEGGAGKIAARVVFTSCEPAPSPLVAAIPERCVNRRPYRRARLPDVLSEAFLAAGRGVPGLRTRLVERAGDISRLASLAALNDRVLFENRPLHAGLQRWLRWTREEVLRTRDGMPIESLELGRAERPGFRLLSRWSFARLLGSVGGTRLLPLRARRTYLRSAAIGLVTVDGEGAEGFVRAGRVVERIWLTATAHKVAFQPITGVSFLLLRLWLGPGEGLSPAHRRLLGWIGGELREMLQLGPEELPVMLFRVGFAEPPTARALRLSISNLLTVTAPTTPSPPLGERAG